LISLAQEAIHEHHTPPSESTFDHLRDHDPESDNEREWNEQDKDHNTEQAVCDDVNGLALSAQRRSYMGISSIHAILRTMLKLRPSLQTELSNRNTGTTEFASASPVDSSIENAIPSIDEAAAIDAYFARIHYITPFLDEVEFRNVWKQKQRNDHAWLALLNMVFVLGSLLVEEYEESSRIYYMRAKMYLDFELLRIGCLESLQALCLLGGYYLHIKNSPNMAFTIMGTAYRIAISLGLHRQSVSPKAVADSQPQTWKPQLRQRMWWSLFILDTWGSMSLDRPTLGRWDPETMNLSGATELEKQDPLILSLDSSREFCVIANKIQHRFAQLLPVTTDEIYALDSEIVKWHESRPRALREFTSGPPTLFATQHTLRNRYFNIRITLYRTVLLRYTNARVSLDLLPPTEQEAIRKCRELACETIDLVAFGKEPLDKVCIGSAVWYLYQASLPLLLSLLVDPENAERDKWNISINGAISFFDRFIPTSRAANRSKQVVSCIHEACTSAVVSEDFSGESSLSDTFAWNLLGQDGFVQEGMDWDFSSWQDDFGLDHVWYR
jgi:hypothetical protein